MILCAAGDTHGAIDRLYDDVLRFEAALEVRFDHVLHVGDFGVWPDPDRIDRATRRHDGAGDFPAWHGGGRAVPRPTVFIKGNHEDFEWLNRRPGGVVLPGLRYLPNGSRMDLPGGVTVGGVGGCHGPSNYERPGRSLQGAARRHYTRDEIERLGAGLPVDVLLLHDAPAGVVFEKRFPSGDPRRYTSEAAGLADLVGRLRPTLCFFGHHHARVNAEVAGVPCIGLNAVGWPGHLVAFELEPGGPAMMLGEWPQP